MKKKAKKEVRKYQPYLTHKNCKCLTPIPPWGLVGGTKCDHGNPTDKFVRKLVKPSEPTNLTS